MAGVLSGCGRFSSDLQKIADSICESKRKNGEKVGEKEILEISEKVFFSYQRVLSIASDAETINIAIDNIGRAVSKGDIDVEKLATQITINAVNERMQEDIIDGVVNNDSSTKEVFISSEKNEEEKDSVQKINYLKEDADSSENIGRRKYNEEDFIEAEKESKHIETMIGVENIDYILEKARNGDVNAAYKTNLIFNAQTQIAFNAGFEKISVERLPEYLQYMILLGKEKESPELKKIYEYMAKKLPQDVFSIDGNGRKKVDDRKLINFYKKECNGKESDIDGLKNVLYKVGEEYIKNPEHQFSSSKELTEESAIVGQNRMLTAKYEDIDDLLYLDPRTPEQEVELDNLIKDFFEFSRKFPDATLRLASSISEEKNRNKNKGFKMLLEATLDSLEYNERNGTFIEDEYTEEYKKTLYQNLTKIIIDEPHSFIKDSPIFFDKLINVDKNLSKKMLTTFIESQNENNLIKRYIQELGEKYGEYSKKIFIDKETIDLKKEVDKKNKDDGEELEGP